MDAATAVADVRAALSGLTGVLPRRAAVTAEGAVAERRAHPQLPEAAALSVACEILRRAAGEPVYSRHTPELLRQCVDDNDAGAWRAMLDDAATGDLDRAAAVAFWSGAGALAAAVRCLVAASSGMHLWLVVRGLQLVVELVGQAGARHLGVAIQRSFADLVRTLSRRAKDVTADMRAGTIDATGRLIVWCGISHDDLCAMLGVALRGGHEDVLRLFVRAPVSALVARDASLVPKLLTSAEKARQASRYPPCALLAVLSPEQLRPHEARVRRVVQRVLDTAAAQGGMDPHLALACGVLAKAVEPARTLSSSLAHALCCMALPHCRRDCV